MSGSEKYYKYRPIGKEGSESRERLKQILAGQLYFAKPSQLNDPFDCSPATIISDKARFRILLSRINKKISKMLGLDEKEIEKKGLSKTVIQTTAINVRNKIMFDAMDKNIGVFCTCKNPVSTTQWSYYGDSHKGICLELTLTGMSLFAPVEVHYTEERPVIDVVKFMDDKVYREKAMLLAIMSKSSDWSLEEEVRLIVYGELGQRHYPKSMLTGVIFGAKTPPSYIEDVCILLESYGFDLSLKQCVQDNSTFKLMVKDLNFVPEIKNV